MTQLALDFQAFRIAMLTGSLPVGMAIPGSINNQLDSHGSHTTADSNIGVGLDALTFCFTCEDFPRAVRSLEKVLNIAINTHDFSDTEGVRGSRIFYGSSGVRLEIRFLAGGNDCRVRVHGGGQAYSHLCPVGVRHLFGYITRLRDYVITRIDLCADDYHGILSLSEIEERLRTGDYANFNGGEVIESIGGTKAGKTVYFGGRSSAVRVRFYDKQAESALDVPCVRQEVQFRGEKARSVFDLIRLSDEGEGWRTITGLLVGSIRFLTRSGKNLTRSCPAAFYEEWTQHLGAIGMKPPSIAISKSFHRTMRWVERSVAKALAVLQAGFGQLNMRAYLESLMESGSEKMKVSDWKEVERYWIEENAAF